jgi:hypothetical protein
MNGKLLRRQRLGITSPCIIKSVELAVAAKRLEIEVECPPRALGRCRGWRAASGPIAASLRSLTPFSYEMNRANICGKTRSWNSARCRTPGRRRWQCFGTGGQGALWAFGAGRRVFSHPPPRPTAMTTLGPQEKPSYPRTPVHVRGTSRSIQAISVVANLKFGRNIKSGGPDDPIFKHNRAGRNPAQHPGF